MKRRPKQDQIRPASLRERTAQKQRTRRDLLAATRALIDRGAEVTLAAVADAAGISRATTYRYFSDPVALSLEAVLDGMVDLPATDLPAGNSVRARVQATCDYWHRFYRAQENRMRLLAARSLAPSPDETPRYQRIARRMPMFAEALKPAAKQLGRQRMRDLTLALTAATGFETYITMKDILMLDDEQMRSTSRLIVDALLAKHGIV